MSRGRRSASLADLQRQYVTRTHDAEVAGLLGLPAMKTPPEDVMRPGPSLPVVDHDAYRHAADYRYRTTFEDLKAECAEAIAEEYPQWADWVEDWQYGRSKLRVPYDVRIQIDHVWTTLMKALLGTMPPKRVRKPKTKRMPPRKIGESSPCVTRHADGRVTCQGEDAEDVANALLRRFDPYAPDPEWTGRDR